MAEVLLKRLNTRGIPAIQSIAVNTVDNVTTVTFNNHPYVQDRFAGGFWVKIAQTIAPGTDVVQFTTSGVPNSTVPLYLYDGTQATAANIASTGKGVHLCFYDSDSKQLQLIA